MARPRKEGLEYFPHDVYAMNDEKLENLQALFGNDGYAFYFKLLERIYRTPEAKIDISQPETLKVLARSTGIRLDRFQRMLEKALELGCFDKERAKNFKELTSNGIQRRAKIVTEYRHSMRDIRAERVQQTAQQNPQQTGESKVKESKIKKNKKIIYPSLKEVEEYFDTNGFKLDIAIKAFNYYSVADWHDSKGNKILNWKQKMQAVWFKDENKINGSVQKELPNHIIATSGTKFK